MEKKVGIDCYVIGDKELIEKYEKEVELNKGSWKERIEEKR